RLWGRSRGRRCRLRGLRRRGDGGGWRGTGGGRCWGRGCLAGAEFGGESGGGLGGCEELHRDAVSLHPILSARGRRGTLYKTIGKGRSLLRPRLALLSSGGLPWDPAVELTSGDSSESFGLSKYFWG